MILLDINLFKFTAVFAITFYFGLLFCVQYTSGHKLHFQINLLLLCSCKSQVFIVRFVCFCLFLFVWSEVWALWPACIPTWRFIAIFPNASKDSGTSCISRLTRFCSAAVKFVESGLFVLVLFVCLILASGFLAILNTYMEVGAVIPNAL